MKVYVYFITILILMFASCCNKKTRVKDTPALSGKPEPAARLMAPRPDETFRCGDAVMIKLRIDQDSLKFVDSIAVSSGSANRQVFYSDFESLLWKSDKARVGKNILKIDLFQDNRKETHRLTLILLSDVVPMAYRYRVVQQYPHDDDAFTQGLIYDKGVLYESTGHEGESTLRIVALKTGIPISQIDLDKKLFAEGIALFNDQIYQITWTTQVGFIYDKKTLSLIRRFDYPIKQGWGLTSDSNRLIMSDGSAQLYFIEPEYFTQTDQIEVYDNRGMVANLNELEYINGKVLANVWYESMIVIIDPENGKVTGLIELEKLMPREAQEDSNKVLNGIAYNPENGHLFITGKNWPVLYELEISPRL